MTAPRAGLVRGGIKQVALNARAATGTAGADAAAAASEGAASIVADAAAGTGDRDRRVDRSRQQRGPRQRPADTAIAAAVTGNGATKTALMPVAG